MAGGSGRVIGPLGFWNGFGTGRCGWLAGGRPANVLRPLYKMEAGDWYSRKKLYDGFRTTQQAYGQGGFMEWTPAPDLVLADVGVELPKECAEFFGAADTFE